jgi:hypothetical protein
VQPVLRRTRLARFYFTIASSFHDVKSVVSPHIELRSLKLSWQPEGAGASNQGYTRHLTGLAITANMDAHRSSLTLLGRSVLCERLSYLYDEMGDVAKSVALRFRGTAVCEGSI